MTHTVDKAGNVDLTIAGKTYRLSANLRAMSELQAKLAVPGLALLLMLLEQRDMRMLYWGLVCLCIDENLRGDFDDLQPGPHIEAIHAALSAAIGIPIPDDEPAAPPADGTGEPGGAIPSGGQ